MYEGTAVDILADGSGESKVAVKVIAAMHSSGNRVGWAEGFGSEVKPQKQVLTDLGIFLQYFLQVTQGWAYLLVMIAKCVF